MNKQELIQYLKQESFSSEIVSAFSKVKREDFILTSMKEYAYENEPLPIGFGATISQPYTIAFMLDLLELDKIKDANKKIINRNNEVNLDRDKSKQQKNKDIRGECIINYNINKNKPKILEIGSGSGYVLALINELTGESAHESGAEIFGVERIEELVKKSREVLKKDKNIKIVHRDGSKGLKEEALFDRILVSAAFDRIPERVIDQLKEGGILVCPVLNSIFQIKKESGKIIKKEFPGFIFVPILEGKE